MNATTTVTVSAEALAGLVRRIFVAAGLAEPAAQTVADGLVDADLEGLASHGVMLVDLYVDRIQAGSVSTADAGTVVSDRSVAVVLDAGNALGHLTGDQAIGLAIERAHRLGAGIVAVRHGFHFGTARRYAVRAAEAGCIGIVGCNTRPLMPAPGGAERVVGNNPLAIAVPTDGAIPLVLDMATSEAAMGKIRMAAKQSKPIPAGWAVDAQGSPTTDPETAIAGMLLPTGGPKGFGLSLLIDLICGLLSGGATGRDVQPLYGDFARPYDCSHIFIAVDVAHFGDVAAFKSAAAAAAEQIRSGKRAPGVDQLFTPGEPEWRKRERAQGQLTLPPAVVDMLTRYATKLGVSPHPLVP
ncbi:Ldh family oxidoreductase [Rhodoplanes sp. Z2-YC6860]|uniref:Ldh family oxidoreductase n=1 Tax=Rhodoplanes sp. Z2-YC6860 TaxID=674703 RepID=UPI00078CBD35|nr:Ldh family oxidoreductase [Rhodoplanes sp. Z2-YC6860]AMN41220.1 malate/L-lactate dehydrogenase [Rhodoplanes sp. Z2-YC6860]